MADLDDADLSVLDRRLRDQINMSLGDLPVAESPTRSMIGSEADEEEEESDEGESTGMSAQSNQKQGRMWQRRQTMVPLRKSTGSEDRTAIPFTPKPAKTNPSRPSAIHNPIHQQSPTPQPPQTDVAPSISPLMSPLPSDGDFDLTSEVSSPSALAQAAEDDSLVSAKTDTSQTVTPHARSRGKPTISPFTRAQIQAETDASPHANETSTSSEGSSSHQYSGAYASTPIDPSRRPYRQPMINASPSSSSTQTPSPIAETPAPAGGSRAIPPSALRSSVRGRAGLYGAGVGREGRAQRKVSVSFDISPIGRAKWEENETSASASDKSAGMEALEDDVEPSLGAKDEDDGESGIPVVRLPASPEEGHDISNSSLSATGDVLSDEQRSPSDIGRSASPHASSPSITGSPAPAPSVLELESDIETDAQSIVEVGYATDLEDADSIKEQEYEDRRSELRSSEGGSEVMRERAVDVMVPLKDEEDDQSRAQDVAGTPARNGKWVDTRPRHRFPSHPPASPYPATPRQARHSTGSSDGNTTTTPIVPPPSNRIPSLSRSSDQSGSGSYSGSESSFERDHPTPGLPQGEFATPVRAAGNRTPGGLSFAGHTPGGISLRPDLDDVDEEVEEGELPYGQDDKRLDMSGMTNEKTHQTVSTQYTTPGQARHLSREESQRQMSLMLGEGSDQEGTPVRGQTYEHSLGKDNHSRSILADLTGISNGVITPSPSGQGMGETMHATPKADKQSAMSRHLIQTLNASAMKPSQRRTGTLSRIGGRARRDRMSSAGTVASAADASVASIDSPGSQAFGEGSISGFQTSTYGNMRDDTGSSAGDLSVISVTSSADLTTDKRASSARTRGNTSVPAIMPSDVNAPDAQFNKNKLVKHLSSVNKALVVENQELRDQLNQERAQLGKSPMGANREQDVGTSGMFGFVDSIAGASPGNVSLAQSDATHDLISELKAINDDLEAACADKDAELESLAARLEQRAGDQKHIEELELKLTEFEQMDDEHLTEMDALREELDEKTSIVLAKEATIEEMRKNFTDQMAVFSDDFGKLMEEEKLKYEEQLKQKSTELQESQWAVTALESEKERLRVIMDTDTLEEKEQALQDQLRELEKQLAEKDNALLRLERESETQREQVAKMTGAVSRARAEVEELAKKLDEADEREQHLISDKDALQSDLEAMDSESRELQTKLGALEVKLQAVQEEQEQMAKDRSTLEASNAELRAQMTESGDLLADLRADLAQAVSEKKNLMHQFVLAEDNLSSMSSPPPGGHPSAAHADLLDLQALVSELTDQLAAAESKVSEMTNQRRSPTPRQKTALEAKELRISGLVQENKALADRVRSLQVQSAFVASPAGSPGPLGGNKLAAGSKSFGSPFINKRLMMLQDPKTPGSIADASWMDTSLGCEAVGISPDQVAQLMDELRGANERLDGDIQNLGDANLVVYSLAERLAQAQEEKVELELQLQEHYAADAALHGRLSKFACPECEVVVDANAALGTSRLENQSPMVSKSRHDSSLRELRQTITDVRERHEVLQADTNATRARMQQRIDVLESKLRAAVDAMNEAVEGQDRSDEEVQRLQRDIQRLTSELSGKSAALDRSRADATRADRLREEQRISQEAISRQLAGSLQAEREGRQKVQRLERDIDALQTRRASSPRIVVDPETTTMRTQLGRLNEELVNAQADLRDSQKDRVQLEQTLKARTQDLADARAAANTKPDDLARACADLHRVETALRTTRQDARRLENAVERLGQEQSSMDNLKVELAALRRGRKEAERRITSLEADLADKDQMLSERDRQIREHSFKSVVKQDQTELRRKNDNLLADRRKLTSQLRYINARYVRENTFRRALQGQKDYLLCLVGRFKQTEQATLAAIASMGFPAKQQTARSAPTFKGAALAVRAIVKMRRLAAAWTETEKERR